MNNLSSYVKLEIFKFFNYEQLKNLSYVNKEFNKLVPYSLENEFIVIFQTCHNDYRMKPTLIFDNFSNIKLKIKNHIEEVNNNYDMVNNSVGRNMLTLISVESCNFNFLQFDISNIVAYIKFYIKFKRRGGYTEYSNYNLFVTVAPKYKKEEIEKEVRKR